jgi:hypothetical protein
LSFGFSYTPGVGYSIVIQYKDGQNGNFMLNQPNCVTFAVFANTDGTFNAMRTQVIPVTSVTDSNPVWPTAVYVEDEQNYTATITVTFTPNDVLSKCTRNVGDTLSYTCYFELAFQVAGVTQQSNYFSLQTAIYDNTATANLNFARMTKLSRTGIVEVTAYFNATAYTVLNNDGSVGSPVTCIQSNTTYYIELNITDSAFKSFNFSGISVYYVYYNSTNYKTFVGFTVAY